MSSQVSTDSSTPIFDVDTSTLPSPEDADGRLKAQLDNAGIGLARLFHELQDVWNQGYPGVEKYGVWLIQAPSPLNTGEYTCTRKPNPKVVGEDEFIWITEPATSTEIKVTSASAWRWLPDGTPVEYHANGRFDPPSPDFFADVQSVLNKYGITVLGVGYDLAEIPREADPVNVRRRIGGAENRKWGTSWESRPDEQHVGFWWQMAGTKSNVQMVDTDPITLCNCCHVSGGAFGG